MYTIKIKEISTAKSFGISMFITGLFIVSKKFNHTMSLFARDGIYKMK